jgi:hypothetical protein
MFVAVGSKFYGRTQLGNTMIKTSYASFGGLIVTGTLISLGKGSHLASFCVSGISYLAGLSAVYFMYRKVPVRSSSK